MEDVSACGRMLRLDDVKGLFCPKPFWDSGIVLLLVFNRTCLIIQNLFQLVCLLGKYWSINPSVCVKEIFLSDHPGATLGITLPLPLRLPLPGPRLLCSYSSSDPSSALLSSSHKPCSYCQTSFPGSRFPVAESLWFLLVFHLWCSKVTTAQGGASAEGP